MLEDYTGKHLMERRQNIGWVGWPLGYSLVIVKGKTYLSRLHDQEYIHNAKKLVNPLDSTTKILKLGAKMANIFHLVQICNIYDVVEHGLTMEDIKRTDKQNWASAQRLCSRKVAMFETTENKGLGFRV